MVMADAKGRNAFGWFVLGCVTGPVALLLLAFFPSIKYHVEGANPDIHGHCPKCAETIFKDAKFCKHCGNEFEHTRPLKPKDTSLQSLVVYGILALLAWLVFTILSS